MNTVKISVAFNDFRTLNIGGTKITDLQIAINIVKASKLKNVRLRLGNEEWDNF